MLEGITNFFNNLSPFAAAFGVATPLVGIFLWLYRKFLVLRTSKEEIFTRLQLSLKSEDQLRAELKDVRAELTVSKENLAHEVLNSYAKEIRDNNLDRAFSIIKNFFESNRYDLARIFDILAERQLAFAIGSAREYALNQALRLSTISDNLLPSQSNTEETLSEIKANLGQILDETGRGKEADPYWEEAFRYFDEGFSAEDDLSILLRHASEAIEKHEPRLAYQLFKRVLLVCGRASDQERTFALAARAGMGFALRRMGRCSEAVEELQTVVNESVRLHGASHEETSKFRGDLALALRGTGELEKALCEYKDAISCLEKIDSQAYILAQYYHGAGHVEAELGHFDEAENYLAKSIEKLMECQNEDSGELLSFYICSICCAIDAENFSKAKNLVFKAREVPNDWDNRKSELNKVLGFLNSFDGQSWAGLRSEIIQFLPHG